MYIAGKIIDHTLVEKSGTYSPADPSDSVIGAHLVAVYGGVESDYSILHLDNDGADAARIMAGDECAGVWTVDDLTGVSFALEDAKKWLKCSVDKSFFCTDSRAATIVSVEVWLADMTAIDTSYSGPLAVPCAGPGGSFHMTFRVLGGRGSKAFPGGQDGAYRIGSGRPEDLRVDTAVTFNICA